MKIIMLGAPGAGKELRRRRFLKNIRFHTFLQEIFSEQTSKMEQSLEKKQKHTWTRDFLYQMNWL